MLSVHVFYVFCTYPNECDFASFLKDVAHF